MKIEHLALWVKDLEHMRRFYSKYFNMESGERYVNEKKGFSSYFLRLDEGARLELMHRDDISQTVQNRDRKLGQAHFAISVGSQSAVNELTEELRKDGIRIAGEPRITGDGYYESVIIDPEGNQVEITV